MEPPLAAAPSGEGSVDKNPSAPETRGVPTDAFINATHKIENPANLPKGRAPVRHLKMAPASLLMPRCELSQISTPTSVIPRITASRVKNTTKAFDTALLGDHHAALVNAGVANPTALDHRLAWHFGAEGANKLNSVDENTPLGKVITNTDLLAQNKLKPSMTGERVKAA
jgi:hypothetical protein